MVGRRRTELTANFQVRVARLKMAQTEKFKKARADSTYDTFDCSSLTASLLKEKSTCPAEDEDAGDPPVVFLCATCKLPVGDSLSWDGCESDENQIRITRATDNVIVGKETRMHEVKKGSTCLVLDLACGGCRSSLGMIYTSTPRNLDHKRLAFCFSVANLDSYVLGSASQVLTAEGAREQPVPLKCSSRVEQELTEVNTSVCACARVLSPVVLTFHCELCSPGGASQTGG
ncbi:LOW QUALITY PROTEIN: protein Mis18-alpha [Synchiropus picturatus]